MQNILPFIVALSVGFSHAFEADHLVAVSSLVTRRNNLWLSLKDGAFWGLGHTSTILLVGSVFLLGRFAVQETAFRYVEAGVGLMLVTLGVVRLYKLWRQTSLLSADNQAYSHSGLAVHTHSGNDHSHRLAYGVGLLHGLAGSGALILTVLTQIRGAGAGMLYLMLFGIGSVAGMMVAAGAFSVPFSARLAALPGVRTAFIIASSIICIGLGIMVLHENILR
jgi:high-affinity nickel permease